MLVTFIIPHKGREELLTETVNSIGRQQFDLSQVNVIVVTQNSELALQPENPLLQLSVISRPTSETISHLRNIGAQESNSQYLAFLDADIELSPNWLNAMIQELDNSPNRALVSAVQHYKPQAPALERLRTVLSNAAIDTNVRFLPGRNLLLKKETFINAGKFPEHLITCEDYYFTDRVHALGDLYYSSSASYIHLGEDKKLKDMFKKEIWRGQSNLQSLAGRKIPLSELPSFLVPIWILLFFIGTVLTILSGNLGLACVSLVLTVLPIFLYSTRLFLLAREQVSFIDILKFYLVYFPARIIGTFTGLFRSIQI